MSLSPTQLADLKAAIIADPVAGPMRAAGDSFSLLAWCNAAADPVQLAWSVAVPAQVSDEAATYTLFDTLVGGKRDSWALFLNFPRSFARNKIRNWVVDVWGAAIAASVAEGILQAGTENATNAQVKLGGTSKTTGTVTALDRNFTAKVTAAEATSLVN